ncbi:MAG: glycosyltransferase family 2 protein [Microgenomates group bacterium]
MKITGITVVKGRPDHIYACLSSLEKIADEVMVVDIGMDESLKQEVMKMKKVTYIEEDHVPYVELIRERVKNKAKYEYVLFLDADEELPPTLIAELKRTYKQYDAIQIARKNMVFGSWVQHSRWWPDSQIRLFKKSTLTWPTKIHQQPVVTGTIHELPTTEELAILHHNYDSIDDFVSRMMRYAKVEATEKIEQKKEYHLQEATRTAISEFVGRYFAGEGYKDGMMGFTLAILQLFYSFLVYFYYWEKRKYSADIEEPALNIKRFFAQGLMEVIYWNPKRVTDKILGALLRRMIK